MAASEKEKTPDEVQTQTKVASEHEHAAGENLVSLPFSPAMERLMPELEELVKKNPNRLIGCGG